MSRRDTIIVATLLNVAILAILFVVAIKTEEEPIESNVPYEIKPTFVASERPIALEAQSEDIDNMLLDLTSFPEESIQEEETKTAETRSRDPADKLVEIMVKKGDVLERIARANGTTIEAIKKINNLKNDKLTIGQILKVPVGQIKKATSPIDPPVVVSRNEMAPAHYILKSGDSPWKIAKELNVNREDLLRLNDLDEERARSLKVGDKIRIR